MRNPLTASLNARPMPASPDDVAISDAVKAALDRGDRVLVLGALAISPPRLPDWLARRFRPRLEPNAFADSVQASVERGEVDAVILAVPASETPERAPATFEPSLDHPSLTLVSSRLIGERARTRLDEYRVGKVRLRRID
jgi:hypothetical protein